MDTFEPDTSPDDLDLDAHEHAVYWLGYRRALQDLADAPDAPWHD